MYSHPPRKDNIRLVEWLKIGVRGSLNAASRRLPSPRSAIQLLDGFPQ